MKKKTVIKKKTSRRPGGGIPPEVIWLKKQFDELHREHNLILGVLKKLDEGNELVIPELEAAITAVHRQAVKIDEQVPDKTVPPGT
jgi:hypothetical protein